MNAIEMRQVRKRFSKGGFELQLPKLEVPQGYVTGFIGENGAGKTTTLKLLMGLLSADEGEMEMQGKKITVPSESAAARQEIAYVGEATGYLEHARLRTIVSMVRPFYPSWDDAAFEGYLRRFSIDLKQKHRELSKGRQKQFALAMALAHHPKLLLLDEPTANLDPLVRSEILEMMAELLEKEGISIFFSTHITSDLDKIADYIKFLHGGRLLLEGEKDVILAQHRVVKARAELLDEQTAALLLDCEKSDFGFRGLTNDAKAAYALLGDEAVYEKPTVEDIFLAYTKSERGKKK